MSTLPLMWIATNSSKVNKVKRQTRHKEFLSRDIDGMNDTFSPRWSYTKDMLPVTKSLPVMTLELPSHQDKASSTISHQDEISPLTSLPVTCTSSSLWSFSHKYKDIRVPAQSFCHRSTPSQRVNKLPTSHQDSNAPTYLSVYG